MPASWTYLGTDLPGAPIATHSLRHPERLTLSVKLRIERHVSGYFAVHATFTGFTKYHGRAEAARLYAQILDTMGDLASADPLKIAVTFDPGENLVKVTGPDALFAVMPFFDEGHTLEETMGLES